MLKDEPLDQFEEALRKLKNKYDQFFAGIQKLPPTFDRHRLDALVHELSKENIRDNSRRFRFNTILARYNQFRELWSRKLREREEGPTDYRSRVAALTGPRPAKDPAPAEPAALRTPPRETSEAPDPYVKITPAGNGIEIEKLFERIRDEHLKQGRIPNLTVEQVGAMVQKQAELVRTKFQVATVAFRVETVDGKVKLKARPIQE